MSRPRKHAYKALPVNLTYDKSTQHYRYRRPDNHKSFSMGKDKAKAITAAKQLNSLLITDCNLVSKVIGSTQTLLAYIENRFKPAILQERELAEKTLQDYQYKLRIISDNNISQLKLADIVVADISQFLSQFPPTQSNRYRSLLNVIFKHAVAEGLISDNPVHVTLNRKIKKHRQRLKQDEYHRIYHHENTENWLKNAMDLSLITLQRREDVLNMKFSDIKEGHLYVIQKKTAKHGASAFLKIKIGNTLQDIIDRCRDALNSPYLIHRRPDRLIKSKTRDHHTKVLPDYLTKCFSAVRDATQLFQHLSEYQRPTFHEIRSLGIKLYEDKGINAQVLAGHTTRNMTEQYKLGHDIEWQEVAAELSP